MKVRNISQKRIREEVKAQIAEYQAQIVNDMADECYRAALAIAIAVFHKRGRSKAYIQKFAEDFIDVLNMPIIPQCEHISTSDLIDQYSEEYGIDFDEVHVMTETINDAKWRAKKNEN